MHETSHLASHGHTQLQDADFGLTFLNVAEVYRNVAVSVSSTLFVPPAQRVKDLVQDNPDMLTPATNGDLLCTTNTSNIGVTAACMKTRPMILHEKYAYRSIKHLHEIYYDSLCAELKYSVCVWYVCCPVVLLSLF